MKMKRFFLVLLAMLLVLSVFTACDDDDDDSRACTTEDYEIICAIIDACDDALEDDYCTYSVSGTTETFTFKEYTCTVTSYYDGSDISVTIESGSTFERLNNTSSYSEVKTFNIDATVDGTSRSLYLKYTCYADVDITINKIKLDGVELTGFDDIDSSSGA